MSKADNVVSEIKETMDYNKFEKSIFQRPMRNLNPLKESMKKYGFKYEYPIIVANIGKSKYEILAGHHRFQAAKELLLPIKYIVSDTTFNNTIELETINKEWSLNDYLQSYISKGNEEYIIIKQYCDETNMPLSTAIFILSNAEGIYKTIVKNFKLGLFEVKNHTFATVMMKACKTLKDNNIHTGRTAKFIRALALCVKLKQFDLEYFINKLVKRPNLLINQTTTDKYIQHIEDIYNYALKNTSKIGIALEIKKNK